MSNHPPTAESDELFWLAMRYVGNELSDSERLHFEERLATDVPACEAVAEAVRLTAGLHTALVPIPQLETSSAHRSPIHTRRRPWAPVALSAALLLLTAVLVTAWRSPTPARVEVATAELLSRWRSDGQIGSMDDGDLEDVGDSESEIVDESLSAPGWLVSAVRLTVETNPNQD